MGFRKQKGHTGGMMFSMLSIPTYNNMLVDL